MSVTQGEVEADLELTGGTVDIVGITLSRVSGPVTLREQKLTTELTGQALGGPLHGTGSVDLRAQHWQATSGETLDSKRRSSGWVRAVYDRRLSKAHWGRRAVHRLPCGSRAGNALPSPGAPRRR